MLLSSPEDSTGGAGCCVLLEALSPGRRVAEMPRRSDPILGKKEQRVVGLFSAGRGEAGGKMGVRDEEDREDGKPGEGVRGVAGLEGGNDDGLELVSSVELSDSLRKWVYLVFGTSSIINRQCLFLNPHKSTQAQKSFSLTIQSFSRKGHTAICLVLLSVRAVSICLAVCPQVFTRQPTTENAQRKSGVSQLMEECREKKSFSAPAQLMLSSVQLECTSVR